MEQTNKITIIILAFAAVLFVIGVIIWLLIRPAPVQEQVEAPRQAEPVRNSGSQTQAQPPPVQSPAASPEAPIEQTPATLEEAYQRAFGELGVQRLLFARVDAPTGERGSVYALYEDDIADARSSFPGLDSYSLQIALTDLGGDGTVEAVVIEDLPGYCGTAGCPLDIYRREGNAWVRIFSTLAGEIVGITESRTNNYAELYLTQGNAIYQYAWVDETYSPWGFVAQWDGSAFVIVQ